MDFFTSTAPPSKKTEEKSSFMWILYLFVGMIILLFLISFVFAVMGLMQRKIQSPQQQSRKLIVKQTKIIK